MIRYVTIVGISAAVIMAQSSLQAQVVPHEPSAANPEVSGHKPLDFNARMADISRQSKSVIIVEGRPLYDVPDPAIALPEAGAVGSTETAIGRLGAAYDYLVEHRENVYVLRKRYSDANDFPTATVPEIQAAAEEYDRLLNLFSPHIASNTELVSNIFATFTKEQIDELPKKTLRVGSLTPVQRELIDQLAGDIYARVHVPDIAWTLRMIQGIPDASFSTGPADQGGANVTPPTRVGATIRFRGDTQTWPVGHRAMSEGHDVDEADAEVKALKEADAAVRRDRSLHTRTLGSIVDQLSARATGKHFLAAADVRDQTAQIFGMENASVEAEFRALAAALGLAVHTNSSDTELALTRRRVPTPSSMLGLPQSLREAIPESLLRANGVELDRRYDPDFGYIPVASPAPSADRVPSRKQRESPWLFNKTYLLQVAATRRLIAAIEVIQEERHTKGEIPASALDERTLSAFAAMLFAQKVSDLQGSLSLRAPLYLVNLDNDTLGGGVTNKAGKLQLSLYFCAPTSDGSVPSTSAGIGGINPPPTLAASLAQGQ